MVKRFWWLNWKVLKALRFGIGNRIEYWFTNRTTSWPETATAYFVRISFDIYKMSPIWSARVWRSWTSGKRVTARSNPSQKKCTGLTFPMNRDRKFLNTLLVSTKIRQNRFTYSESYVACDFKRDWFGNFAWGCPDVYRGPKWFQCSHRFLIKFSYR